MAAVPDYQLLRQIGGGAYGEVWLARSKATHVFRAAKIVWRHTFDDDRPYLREFEGIQRFERISREHPSQLALFHIGRNDAEGYFYYILELADSVSPDSGCSSPGAGSADFGQGNLHCESYAPHTLREDLRRLGRLSAARVLEVGLALAEALGHLHSHGLVHRDIKPSNVIFVNGVPKLADIGLVTEAGDSQSIVGTEGYLSPEGPGTPQADIFALGKVLYEAVTGLDRREFPKLPKDLRSWPDAGLVFELNAIILAACAADPRGRYFSVEAMLTDLQRIRLGKSVKRRRSLQRCRAMAGRLCLGAAVGSLVGIGAVVVWGELHKDRPRSTNPNAEKLYWQAVDQLRGGSLQRIQQGYAFLNEAVRLDPGFADAYYKMLDVYKGPFADELPPYSNQVANLRMVAERVRDLRPGSAQYLTVHSMVMFREWKFDEAIAEAAQAKKLAPGLLRAHGLYAWYVLLAHGDAATALEEYRTAERQDYADVTIQTVLADAYYSQRRFDQAIEQLQQAAAMDHQAPLPHRNLARVYEATQQFDKALKEYEQFDLLCGRDQEETVTRYRRLHAVLDGQGPSSMWQVMLEEARQSPRADPYWVARVCARLGHTDEVFTLLKRAYNEHNSGMLMLLLDDAWEPYRSEQLFQELLNKIGFRRI